MVSTTQIKPAPMLQPYISCYALREFDTEGTNMVQPMHAVQECYMTFFLKERFCVVISESGYVRDNISNSLTTFFTEPNGYVCWKGSYVLMCVQFKANGFFALFGVPQQELINNTFAAGDFLGNDSNLMTEQLAACKDINAMGNCLDDFFIKKLLRQKHSYYTNTIAHISNIILHEKGVVSLDGLAYHANMSIRTFQRRFLDEVGMSPKLYARITRFHHAVDSKMLHPHISFTAIAYECGYYDQAHFIKECREFSKKTPEELFKYTPPPTEKYVAKIDY